MTALDNVRALQAEVEQLKRGAERWQEKADNFRLLYSEAMDQLKERSEEVDRLRSENKRLRNAIDPAMALLLNQQAESKQ
jgi:hypothetical protein